MIPNRRAIDGSRSISARTDARCNRGALMQRADTKTSGTESERDRGTPAPPSDEHARSDPKLRLDPPTISLPKGGGALKSIDETYTVNPSNGTCSLSLPLPFSPSRGGYMPPVRARYDSGSGILSTRRTD